MSTGYLHLGGSDILYEGAGYGSRFAFSFFLSKKENICSHQFLNWLQQVSTGHLHLDGFDSLPAKKARHPSGVSCFLEQDTGVEPAFTAWEAVVLPIYESCVSCGYYSKENWKIQPLFVGRKKEAENRLLFYTIARI